MRAQKTIPLTFLSLSVLLWGCPYSSVYKLDDAPGIFTEDLLIGNWATTIQNKNNGAAQPVKMILSRKNETEYNIAFTGAIDELRPYKVIMSDTLKASAFMSTVAGGHQILNIFIKGKTYLAELKYEDGKLSLLPLSEHFTSKIVQSNGSLRSCVEFHYKTRTRPSFDEEFCLKDMVKVN